MYNKPLDVMNSVKVIGTMKSMQYGIAKKELGGIWEVYFEMRC